MKNTDNFQKIKNNLKVQHIIDEQIKKCVVIN